MKITVYRVVCFLIAIIYGVGLSFLDVPLWTSFLVLPVFLYAQLYLTLQVSFRDSLMLEAVPETGYEKRLAALDANQLCFAQFDFQKFDEIYLQTVPDSVCYLYNHEKYPVQLADIHNGENLIFAFKTKFDNGFSLETSNYKNAGITLSRAEKMLQVFPERSFQEVLEKHLEGISFLNRAGFMAETPNPLFARQEFLSSLREEMQSAKTYAAPGRLLYRMAFQKHKIHRKTIQEQHLAKTLALP